MGVSVSRYSQLTENELLKKFCSTEVICANDPFWNQLLAYNISPPASQDEQLLFDSSTETLLQLFLSNNPQTGNLGCLVQVFITRATELLASPSTDNAMLAWQTFNALFLIRAVIKYLVEMVPEYQLGQHLDAQVERKWGEQKVDQSQDSVTSRSSSESRLEMLCDALVGLICDVPVTDNTYYLHLECINSLLVLLSVYMFAGIHGQTRLVDTSPIYRTIFQGRYGIHAPLLVKTLLNNLVNMTAAPPTMFGYDTTGGSLVINIASGLWNMLTFNSAPSRPTILTNPPIDKQELSTRLTIEHPVANQSCLLLLALTNHCMNDDNLYRRALLMCEDSTEISSRTPSKETVDSPTSQVTPPRINMAALHTAICATVQCEHSVLLLYQMLHSCKQYKKFVYTGASVEQLIIPLLQCLYNAPENNSHHIYMSLIVVLILTEDDSLIKKVHQIQIKSPVWYSERALSSVSLGGLIVLVVIRTVQYNIVRVRDKYLHTNCLAALANMSCEFRNLHPYVAQRLVSLFETLSKRRQRLTADIEGTSDGNGLDLVHRTVEKTEDILDHICVLDEVLRMLLEIVNSCLSSQLPHNLNLVYALLHKKHVFAAFNAHDAPPVYHNIEMVIGYFSSRLQRVQDGVGGDLGVNEVLHCIKKGAEQWSNDRLKWEKKRCKKHVCFLLMCVLLTLVCLYAYWILKLEIKFPELKFRYEEEERPEEFFTPYVWTLISTCGNIYWASECSARAVKGLVAC